jgi:hypothetical protein
LFTDNNWKVEYYLEPIAGCTSSDFKLVKKVDQVGREMHTDDGWLFKAMAGKTFELGKGWSGRIERHGSENGYQRHAHVYDSKHSYSQIDEGSPHDDGKNSPGGPPKKVLESLKDKKGWDWKGKENDWINKCDIYLDAGGLYNLSRWQ